MKPLTGRHFDEATMSRFSDWLEKAIYAQYRKYAKFQNNPLPSCERIDDRLMEVFPFLDYKNKKYSKVETT